jgi:hypothetical protein
MVLPLTGIQHLPSLLTGGLDGVTNAQGRVGIDSPDGVQVLGHNMLSQDVLRQLASRVETRDLGQEIVERNICTADSSSNSGKPMSEELQHPGVR